MGRTRLYERGTVMRGLRTLLVVGLVLGMSGQAMAASDSISANASATVIAPITVAETTQLNFGKFSVGTASGGTVTISTADVRGATGTVKLADAAGSVPAAGLFTVGGADLGYTITVAATSTLTNGTPADDMTATLTKSKATGTIASGTDTFKVSASLAVAASQTPGSYAGTYSVSVAYQ